MELEYIVDKKFDNINDENGKLTVTVQDGTSSDVITGAKVR